MAKLTKRTLDSLKTKDKDYFVWDDGLKGFGVRVLTTGRKTFLAQYRSGGIQRRVKIGQFGAVTADQARNLAKEILGDVAGGANPAEDIRTYRMAPTVASVCERFMDEYVAVRCKPSTAYEYRRSVDLFIKPNFGNRKIADIARPDIAKLHHELRDKPYQANRTLGVLFNLCEIWGLRPDGSNPCRHVRKYPEQKRERFLSPKELATLGQVLDELEAEGSESPHLVAAFRLLIMTGCRLSEIQTLQWLFIMPGYIHLPDSKTGARKIPIGPAVQNVLDTLPRMPGNPYVIAGTVPGQHLTDLQRPWRRIRKRAGLEDVRIHDLRHTFASNAISNGLPLEMVGKLLGHTQFQTTMRYAHIADDPYRAAAEQVSGSLAGSMKSGASSAVHATGTPQAAVVVPFPKGSTPV